MPREAEPQPQRPALREPIWFSAAPHWGRRAALEHLSPSLPFLSELPAQHRRAPVQQVQGRLLWGCHEGHGDCLSALPLPVHRCLPQVGPSSGQGEYNWVSGQYNTLGAKMGKEVGGLGSHPTLATELTYAP